MYKDREWTEWLIFATLKFFRNFLLDPAARNNFDGYYLPAVRLRSLPPELPSAGSPLYCFYLMLCENIDFIFEKVSKREQMQTKTL